MANNNDQITLHDFVEINQKLLRSSEPDEVIKAVLQAAIQLFKLEACSLALIDDNAEELAFVAMESSVPVSEFRIPMGEGIAGTVAKSGEIIVCNDVSQDNRFSQDIDQKTNFVTRSILCAPIRQNDRIIGVIEALNTRRPQGFQDEDSKLLASYGVMAGTAITHTQSYSTVQNTNAAYREVIQNRYALVAGESEAMNQALATARKVAETDTTVLILGETGTGKEVISRAVHEWSPRSKGPFVAVNCMALTPELLTSELFGHEKGAFTGATSRKKGKFELAQGGTIFLDEIGDLEPDLQARLLRVLQEKEFERVGGEKTIRADVRVLAATNRDLHKAMAEHSFREDLYYRLNVVAINMPPLRDRRSDIPNFVDHFVARFCQELNRPLLKITESAMTALQNYRWPGNVRELQNVIERAVVLSPGPSISISDFAADIRQLDDSPAESNDVKNDADEIIPLADAVRSFKRDRVSKALAIVEGNHTRAAKLLGMQPPNLTRLMRSLDLN